jgi:hypothetical protein
VGWQRQRGLLGLLLLGLLGLLLRLLRGAALQAALAGAAAAPAWLDAAPLARSLCPACASC